MRLVVNIIEMFVYVKVFLVIGVVYKVFKWYNIMEENFCYEIK